MTVAHGHPWAVWGRTFALMSITHPFGSDVKSMSEFYNKRFLRAVTLPYSSTSSYMTTCSVTVGIPTSTRTGVRALGIIAQAGNSHSHSLGVGAEGNAASTTSSSSSTRSGVTLP